MNHFTAGVDRQQSEHRELPRINEDFSPLPPKSELPDDSDPKEMGGNGDCLPATAHLTRRATFLWGESCDVMAVSSSAKIPETGILSTIP